MKNTTENLSPVLILSFIFFLLWIISFD